MTGKYSSPYCTVFKLLKISVVLGSKWNCSHVNNVLEIFLWEAKGLYVNKRTMIEDSIFDINRKLPTHFTVRIVSEEISQKSRNLQVDKGVCLTLKKKKLGKRLEEGRLPNQLATYAWWILVFMCVHFCSHFHFFILSWLCCSMARNFPQYVF